MSLAGQHIGRFRLDEQIGAGTLGTVYRALDLDFRRDVALKLLRVETADFQQTLLPAVQAAAQLDHPNVADIHDVGDAGDSPFIVSEFLPARLSGHFPAGDGGRDEHLIILLRLLAQAADGLDHVHRRGLIHGHLKPANLLLKPLGQPDRPGDPPRRLVITDVGLMRTDEWDVRSRPFLETVRYWSPEQVWEEDVDSRSDLYSFGVVVYQVLTGQLPLAIDSLEEAQQQHKRGTVQPVTAVSPALPSPLNDFVQQAIAPIPADRFQSGAAMADALRRLAAGLEKGEYESVFNPTWAGQDQLRVFRGEQLVQTVHLSQQRVTIGSAADNDVVLEDNDVAPYHAQLRRTMVGWSVQDRQTRIGTFIDETRLLPDRYEDWETTQVLGIGPFLLRWDRSAAETAVTATTPTAVSTTDHPVTDSRPLVADLRLALSDNEVTVSPGEQTALEISLRNRATRVGKFRAAIEGLPPGWYTLSRTSVQLLPDAGERLLLTLHPPRHAGVTAGEHSFQVAVHTPARPAETAVVAGTLIVTPFYDLETELHPAHFQQAGQCRLTVSNQGNAPLAATVRGRDPAEAVRFGGETQHLQLEPGTMAHCDLAVAARSSRPWLGRTRQLPFAVRLDADPLDEPLLEEGQVELKPVIPVWVPVFVSTIITFACIALGIFLALR